MSNKLFILLSAVLLLFAACKPCTDPTNPECENYCDDPANPDCFNYDPCTAQAPISADFWIVEDSGLGGFLSIQDTVYFDTLWFKDLSLKANYQGGDRKFTWYIGSERYEQAELSLDFWSAPRDVQIPITLVLETNPDPCFPDSDGRDTVTHYVVFTDDHRFDFREQPLHFFGFLNGNPEDTITIKFFSVIEVDNRRGSRYENLKRGCVLTSLGQSTQTTRIWPFDLSGSLNCDGPRGEIVLDPDKTGDFDKVRMTYTLYDRTDPEIKRRYPVLFEGRKL